MIQSKPKRLFHHFFEHRSFLRDKFSESCRSVFPIAILVLLLCFVFVPIPISTLLGFLLGTVLLIVGMSLFTLGSDLAMAAIGKYIGSAVTHSRKLWLILGTAFLVGMFVTIAEPDLQVLAGQVPGVPDVLLVVFVALGVAVFLTIAILRIIFKISIGKILAICYACVFILAFFVPKQFLAVAFDSGGVTTGPMTVPFIMSLGVGISSIRSDRNADNDSFGLVALASVGPIMAVMILSMIYIPQDTTYSNITVLNFQTTTEIAAFFLSSLPKYLAEVGLALLPIVSFFLLFQFTILHLNFRELIRIFVGLIYTFVGLVLFLTGANTGFMPMGLLLGKLLASMECRWLIIPIGMLIGYFAVKAEPAIHVLNNQVYQITAGTISPNTLSISLSISVSAAIGLAMLRVLTKIPILYFLIPGYAVAFALIPFVPPIFTSIAFDSGGVASGPLTATFLLPIALGANNAIHADDAGNAFGVVAMVAMTPLITVQLLGLISSRRRKHFETDSVSNYSEEIIE